MCLDIFSSFDPRLSYTFTNTNSFIFWYSTIFSITLCASNFWAPPTQLKMLIFSVINFIQNQVTQTSGFFLKGFPHLIRRIFLFIIIINISGNIPYMFSLRRHLILTLTIALPLWTALILSSSTWNPYIFIAILLPGNAPLWLNPFLIIVETLSIIVRPITLSFRLAANIRAGHIVTALMTSYSSSILFLSIKLFIFLVTLHTLYILFEIGIALIQRYIFCLLLSLYRDEHSL